MQRVVIAGAGHVGSTAALMYGIGGWFDEIVLIDKREAKAYAEATDIMCMLRRMNPLVKVRSGSYKDCAEANTLVLCAAAPVRLGQTRNEMFAKNSHIAADVVQKAEEAGFGGLYLVVTNPVDLIVQYMVERLKLVPIRVVGTGTLIDCMRMDDILHAACGHGARVSAYALGEHGEGLVIDWYHTGVNDKSIAEESRDALRRAVIDTAYDIQKGKGSTSYGIAQALIEIEKNRHNRDRDYLMLSLYLDGEYDLQNVAVSVPVFFDLGGFPHAVSIELEDDTLRDLQASAKNIRSAYKKALEQ